MSENNGIDEIKPVFEESKNIRPISKDAVHRICSGQVVLSLAVAVKELVENSVDAGATNIEIRLKEYGSELIEVTDNGSGVEECNFEALTLKHYTSKIREFSDLASVSTLGFRGEALSSLCALANLSVVTRHTTAQLGTKIEYDHNGHIKSKTPCARQIGTTVSLTNLFSSLPVRHKEFIKNIKREFSKMCQLLYAYCMVAEGVRMHCVNQSKKGTRTTIVSTPGTKELKENIVCVFGVKQLENLIEIVLHEPDESIMEDFGIKKPVDEPLPFTFTGYISKCSHGYGRASSDRQFYYINSRPCEPVKLIKLVNEVYKYFNGNQYPFVFLNIKTKQSQIDVNVTPDKRTVFLEQEKLLLATMKTSLLQMFKNFPSTLKIQNLDIQGSQNDSQNEKQSLSETFKQWTNKNDKSLSQPNRGVKRSSVPEKKVKGIMAYIYEKRLKVAQDFSQDLSEASEDEEKQVEQFIKESYNSSDSEMEPSPIKRKINHLNEELKNDYTNFTIGATTFKITIEEPKSNVACKVIPEENIQEIKEDININPKIANNSLKIEQDIVDSAESATNEIIEIVQTDCDINLPEDKFCHSTPNNDSNTIDIGTDEIRSLINKLQSAKMAKKSSDTVVKFRSDITSKNAEQELEKEISKDMFEKMSIIGQFNKGFIITKLDSDLFIIDQHATDEKYNFETLQKTTVIENQKLVNPKPLELTADNECLLIENIEIFHKNGFTFNINEDAEPRKKVSLTAIPVSKNYVFGKDDIDEILFMLQEDSSISNCRPSRVRAMFASRACRKSVMVGSTLSNSEMRRLVDHMGQIEQPWNCPHGRPTMRHLVNLDLLEDK